ncbi:MAG TPA: hypothetical protein VMF89_13785, partial [Polyangiales bacterium]|nr:hypothetical protein [Polyangiales bacterium]
MPASYVGFVRLPLNYLCDGISCDAGNTCIEGACKSEAVPDLQAYERVSPSTACFDVAKCFSMAKEVILEAAEGCSFEAAGASATDLNVAVRLEPGSDGTCTQTACWVVLDADANGDRVSLPEALCKKREEGSRVRVVLSSQCPAKQPGTPLCRSSDVQDAARTISVGVSTPPPAAECKGEAKRACERCGTQTRACKNGLWSAFGMCTNQGVCEPEAAERCGAGGLRTCARDCSWGSCEDQSCDGPATRACGSCGTQHRSCADGAWSEWSTCSDEGACQPGSEQDCGAGGTQACQGDCQWSACTMQVCDGAASAACGQCGMRTRACDTSTAEWSDWSECRDEGECEPDAVRACGRDGTQTCGGNCRWDSSCAGQACDGAARRACGLCGTQTRTCDRSSGTYADWSACSDESECNPGAESACGAGGARTCGSDCRWSAECTGQDCVGASNEVCGDCGRRARSCDTSTGEWSDWGSCEDQGECTPGATRSCGSDGTQSCSDACRWDDV